MIIDQKILDELSAQAKANPRLRQNYDLRTSHAGQWHSLEVLEEGTVIFEAKDGPYEPMKEEDVLASGQNRREA